MTGLTAQQQRLSWGVTGSLIFALLAGAIWGRTAMRAAGIFGGVATLMQWLAARAMARTGGSASVDQLKVYGLGVILRFAGIAVLGVVVSLDRRTFPPLASATGYLGTVLTLLYLETRLSR